MKRGWCIAFLVAAAACGADESSEEQMAIPDPDPEATFSGLEERLLAAESVQLNFHVVAEGAVEVELSGALHVSRGGTLELTGSGHFAGQPVELDARGADGIYEFGSAEGSPVELQPDVLREAVLIGFTRMGILHNLARLTGSAPPDHAEGGVREWVTVSSFADHPVVATGATFDLAVSGEPSGTASIALDVGHPLERIQTVVFPSGEMRVVETYSQVLIAGR